MEQEIKEKLQKIYSNLTQLRECENEENKGRITILKEIIEKIRIKTVEDYIEEFDKVFELTSDEHIKKCPMLMQIFTTFIREIHNLDLNNKLIDMAEREIEDLMKKTFTDKQMILVEVFQFINDRKNQEMEEKAFIMGYAMSEQIKSEIQSICN